MTFLKAVLLLALCSVATVLLQAQSLEGFVPADATTVASFKLREIFNLPVFKNEKNSEIQELRSKIEKFDFTGSGIPRRIMAIYGSSYKKPIILIPTALPASQFEEQLKKISKEIPDIKYEKLTQGNFEGYRISSSTKIGQSDSFYVYHLTGDVIAVLMDDTISPGYLQAGSTPNPLTRVATHGDSNELVRIVNAGLIPNVLEQNAQGLQQILITISKANAIADSFEGYAELSFDKPEAAGQATMMLQMLFTIMTPTLFKENPTLSSDIIKAVGFQTKGNKTIIDAHVTAALLDKLKTELENVSRDWVGNNVANSTTTAPTAPLVVQ